MAQELLPPQLITKARMLYFCWVPANPVACAALLPAGLLGFLQSRRHTRVPSRSLSGSALCAASASLEAFRALL